MRTTEQNVEYSVVELNTNELTEVLKGITFGTLCYMEFHTKVRMNKGGNPYYEQITKITKGNFFVGGKPESYQRRVINETGNKDFVPEKNNVGQHLDTSSVLFNEKLNRYYLQYEWFDGVKNTKPVFQFGGDEIEKRMFESYLVKSNPNKYGVNIQSVMVSNVKRFHHNHIQYVVITEQVEVIGQNVEQPIEV